MIEVARIYRFRARHSLPDMPEPWCHEHEHDYTVEVVARGVGPVVVETDEIDTAWNEVVKPDEFSNLNDAYVSTTVEALAQGWLDELKECVPAVRRVTVWEDKQRWGRAST